ncbi:MAG: DUF4340 domain-containing protein [Verrucomicrobiota bacterium]
MNSKTTGIWFLIAAALFAFVFFWHRHVSAPAPDTHILPGLLPAAVTSVQVIPAAAPELRADHTNSDNQGKWLLTQPVVYPAQSAAIGTLLDSLQRLTFATRISAGELRAHPNASADYGLDNPQFSLVIVAPGQHWQLRVGNKTAPGDQVYLTVGGVDGVFVADSGWLNAIPRVADDWRDSAIVDADTVFDHVILTNNARGTVIELARNPTNHLWRMFRPLSARADNERMTGALQKLYSARLSQFITAGSPADLTAFGLQPPDLDVWLGRDTNFATAFDVGKSPTNDPTSVFVRREGEGWNVVAVTPREPLSPWRASVNDFRDPNLIELTAPVTEIEVRGTNQAQNFTLQRHGTNDWAILGEPYAGDAASVQNFITLLAGLRVAAGTAGFVKDVVTEPDLRAYGLAPPTRQITLRSAVGDTNAIIAQLQFGATGTNDTTQTNVVYVRRTDEDCIYGIPLADYLQVPEHGWEFRDKHIWHFNVTNIVSITLHEDGKTRQILRNSANEWSLAPGSQGMITSSPALEETAYRLGDLTVLGWVGRNFSLADLESIGWNTNKLQMTVELKDGTRDTVDFIQEWPQGHTALAAVTLEGERWVFDVPPVLFQFVLQYLTIPANVP